MGIVLVMEIVLIILLAVLSTILVFKLLYKLRSALPWRVNCWFCNSDFWVKFLIRNSWTCPKCDQYNGFTKEGDYNKPIITNNDQTLPPRVFQKSPPKNGLCKMCNINQQLKVAQLASFVPMYEKKFDEEIEIYRAQLEKAYKLCSPCKRLLQMKLHKEKETLLATKLLEKRSSNNNGQNKQKQNPVLKSFIHNTSTFIATILIIMVAIELYKNIENHKNLPKSVTNIKQIVTGLFERIVSIVKMKALMTFPVLENYLIDVNVLFVKLPKLNLAMDINSFMSLTQKALGGFVCFIHIIGHVWNIYKQKYTIALDLLWSVFVIASMSHHMAIDPVFISIIKLASTTIVLLIYRSMKNKPVKTSRIYTTPKIMKNLVNGSKTSSIADDDNLSFDTDDDVSLSKFGLRNFSDSSNDTISNSLNIGSNLTPRCDNVWTKPKHNSTFCVNSVISKSPSSVSETVFAKPSFNQFQKFDKDDSDSDLDESISSLCISSPKKARKMNPIFSLRKFNPTPTFVTPTAMNRARPLISPSKLGHGTSWVAGGYWGSDGERQLINLNGSRSSSQSSGFESQTSSVNQRNLFSQPPSREESVCGEPMMVDSCQMPSYNGFQAPQSFSRVSSPVFPQMQYNSHVHIPQPRFAHQNAAHGVFSHQQYVQNSMFKTPGGSGLIKLPQVNSFSSN